VLKTKKLKILFIVLTALPLILRSGCKWASDEITEPVIPPVETGMWFVGQLNTNGDARCVKGFIINGTQYAFLADGLNGLQIINISDASNPTLESNYKTFGNVKEVYIDSINGNKYAFLSDIIKGLFILNVSNPVNPVLDTLITYQGGVNSVNIKNRYAYAALTQGSVKVINLNSLPDSVFEINTYNPQNPVEHIEISGNTEIFIEQSTGLEFVDISNPANPVYLSVFQTPGSCYNISVGGNLAYVADGSVGISVINISNPSQPYFVSTKNTKTDVRGINYSPNFLFTAEYGDGVEVFNTFSPAYPEDIGYYEPPGLCYSVHYFKGKVLIANGQKGLLILRF
jgi:hypothetical protein